MNTSTLYADPSDDFSLPKGTQMKEYDPEEEYELEMANLEMQADAELDFDLMLFGDTGDDE